MSEPTNRQRAEKIVESNSWFDGKHHARILDAIAAALDEKDKEIAELRRAVNFKGHHICAHCFEKIAPILPINEGRIAVIQHATNCPAHPCAFEIQSLRRELNVAKAEVERLDSELANTVFEIVGDNKDDDFELAVGKPSEFGKLLRSKYNSARIRIKELEEALEVFAYSIQGETYFPISVPKARALLKAKK